MNRFLFVSFLVLVMGGASACVVRGRLAGNVHATQPDMVMIDGGVYVVEGHSRPVFYDSGYYWWNDNGVWLRSSYYDSGFTRVHVGVVPGRVRGIRNHRSYVRYRGRPGVRRRGAIRSRSRSHARPSRARPARRPAVRSHRPAARSHRPAARPSRRSAPARRGPARKNDTRPAKRPSRDRDHR